MAWGDVVAGTDVAKVRPVPTPAPPDAEPMNESIPHVVVCAECHGYAEAPLARLYDPYGLPTRHFICQECRGVILDRAAEWDADAIFLGARGLNPIERLLIGDVAAAVAMGAPCSAEVTR